MIQRLLLDKIHRQCFKKKVIILLGQRQVGKTTLLQELNRQLNVPSIWLNADEADIRNELTEAKTSTQLLNYFGKQTKLVIIDEAQQIPDIGRKLKLIYDSKSDIQVIATGSSSFDLQDETNEALTGRKAEFYLYPISFQELVGYTSLMEEKRLLNTRLVYGTYPEVINKPGEEANTLFEIGNSYLYKDVLKYEGIRKSSVIEKLLQAIAYQIGREVSYSELASTVGIDKITVEKYLDIFEKAFIIFKLPAFNRNYRNEIKKGKKYYFYDNGLRNMVINNYAPISMRPDKGALWENYIISERIKYLEYNNIHFNKYFWRTKDQAEIDYLEEGDGIIHAYEIKWKVEKARFPVSFIQTYPNHRLLTLNTAQYIDFISSTS